MTNPHPSSAVDPRTAAAPVAESERIEIVEPGQRWKVDLDIGDQLIGTRA
jgi:hypothetical protein